MKNLVFVFVGLFLSFTLFSQDSHDKEQKKFLFGISLGYNQPNLIVDSDFVTDDQVINVKGFSVGSLAEMKFTDNISFLSRLGFTFGGGEILFLSDTVENFGYKVIPISLDLSGHFMFKKRGGKLNPYFLIGPSYNKVIRDKDSDLERWSSKSNVTIDFGVGLDYLFKKFIFAPELVYSYGLVDINSNSDIESIKMHTISLVFNFKG